MYKRVGEGSVKLSFSVSTQTMLAQCVAQLHRRQQCNVDYACHAHASLKRHTKSDAVEQLHAMRKAGRLQLQAHEHVLVKQCVCRLLHVKSRKTCVAPSERLSMSVEEVHRHTSFVLYEGLPQLVRWLCPAKWPALTLVKLRCDRS